MARTALHEQEPEAAAAPSQVRIDKPDTNQLKAYGESERDGFNAVLLNAVVGTL